jgi:hypothetical protein
MDRRALAAAVAAGLWGLLWPRPALAHCDGLDGPVVTAAREALQKGNVNLVLVWVQKNDEPEILRAFEQTLAVRKLGPEAMELADTYFFEMVVRMHRAGEGAPYTGLKPAGRDLGPAIPAADTALRAGNADPLIKLLSEEVARGVREHFKRTRALVDYAKDDVEAGRRFVEAYVAYIHFVERIHEAADQPAEGHYAEVPARPDHH